MSLVIRGAGSDRDFADNGVHAKAEGKNCGVCRREAVLGTMYSRGEDGGIHQVPQVVVPRKRNHTCREGGRAKDK